jgi:tetratricopeptide (TPR) repeat protein
MKKTLILLLISISSIAFTQNMQVQNMVNYLRNKDYVKAKASADLAAEHDDTKNSAKMWMYRGNVYKAIADTSARDQIDPAAEEKALEAYINCLTLDKGKDIYKDQVKGNLVRTAGATRNKASYYKFNKQYDQALKCYDLLEKTIPFDFDGGIKRNNITKEKLLFDRYEVYKASGNKEKTKEMANNLMEIKYKDPTIYTDMIKLSLLDKDTAAALSYIEKGKTMFEDNMMIIGTEIDIYLARKKTNELRDKLISAIEIAPDNEVLHAILGQVYVKSNDTQNAEKEYLKALEIKPDYEVVNYNLGAMYFSAAADYNKKLNDLPPNETAKAKEYEEKVKENFRKAIPYFEKAYEMTPDKAYKQRLYQAYSRLGDSEKAAKYK